MVEMSSKLFARWCLLRRTDIKDPLKSLRRAGNSVGSGSCKVFLNTWPTDSIIMRVQRRVSPVLLTSILSLTVASCYTGLLQSVVFQEFTDKCHIAHGGCQMVDIDDHASVFGPDALDFRSIETSPAV